MKLQISLIFIKESNFIFYDINQSPDFAEYFTYFTHFSNSEINNLKESNFILTTEKDFVRLQPRLANFPIYYLPIKTSIIKEQEASFKRDIIDAIVNFS